MYETLQTTFMYTYGCLEIIEIRNLQKIYCCTLNPMVVNRCKFIGCHDFQVKNFGCHARAAANSTPFSLCDHDIQTWPRYSEDLSAHQNFHLKPFISESIADTQTKPTKKITTPHLQVRISSHMQNHENCLGLKVIMQYSVTCCDATKPHFNSLITTHKCGFAVCSHIYVWLSRSNAPTFESLDPM